MSQEPSKARRGKRFPYYDLSVAIDIIEKIKDGGVDKLESMMLANIIGHKSDASSTFKAKISSAKHYGLIDESKEKTGERQLIFYSITDLGKKIATPISLKEKQDALRLAFFNCSLWEEVYNNYREIGKLPERSTLENVLERTHGISPISKSIAYDALVNSGKVTGLLIEKDDEIFYSKIEMEEIMEDEKEEKEVSRVISPITTIINVTIEVDTKDDSSVKNFINILETLQKIQKKSQ